MAIMTIDLFSKSLGRTVSIRAILPVDKRDMTGRFMHEETELKALYLLHGILGSESDWINGTRICEWAQNANLAVFMPAGENRFYIDNAKSGDCYGTFIGEELVELTRRMFPLSRKKEDTFIAGLSMGGYGALRNGLRYPETFGFIGALSSALIIDDLAASNDEAPMVFQRRSYYESIFGDLDKVAGSDADPKALIQMIKSQKIQVPAIYMACGTEDFLIQKNRAFHEYLEAEGIAVTYEEGPGTHSWMFWDTYIRHFLDWLPLEAEQNPMSSAHVR